MARVEHRPTGSYVYTAQLFQQRQEQTKTKEREHPPTNKTRKEYQDEIRGPSGSEGITKQALEIAMDGRIKLRVSSFRHSWWLYKRDRGILHSNKKGCFLFKIIISFIVCIEMIIL